MPCPREWFHFGHLCDVGAEIPADRDQLIQIMRAERLLMSAEGDATRRPSSTACRKCLLDRTAAPRPSQGNSATPNTLSVPSETSKAYFAAASPRCRRLRPARPKGAWR